MIRGCCFEHLGAVLAFFHQRGGAKSLPLHIMVRLAFWHRFFPKAICPDYWLVRRLAGRIESDRALLEATRVHVYVLEGHVMLYGFVRGEAIHRRLLDVVQSVPGVRSVETSLHVLPAEERELVGA